MKRYYPGEKQINSEKSHCYNICIACVFLFASCGDKKYNGENTAKYHKITAVEARGNEFREDFSKSGRNLQAARNDGGRVY